jgi:antitoxin component of MazEF toxin-antitoxin module
MILRVERRGDEFVIAVPREVVEKLHLLDGGEVDVRPVSREGHRYASVEEALEAFHRTEPQHRESYRKLAE